MFKILQKAIKHRYLLSWLIAFFIGGILYSMKVCASSPIPSPDSSTVELVQVVSEMLNSMMFTSHYLEPISSDSFNANFDFGALPYTDLWTWDSSDFNVTQLNSEELSTLLTSSDIYNESNVQLDSNSDVYLLTFDNGFFHGNAYIDSNGQIIYKDNKSVGDKLLQVALGGDILDVEDMIANYEDLADDITSYGYNLPSENIVDPSTLTNVNRTLYFYFGVKARLYNRLDLCYIPNMYNSNFYFNTSGVPLTIYSDLNPSLFITKHGTDNTATYNQSVNQSANNKTWNYKIQFPTTYGVCTLAEYNSYSFSSGTHPYLIDYNGNTFNSQYYNYVQNNDVIGFEQLVSDNGDYDFDGEETYSYKDLYDAIQTLGNIQVQPNPDYDPNSNIGSTNYPQQKTIPQNFSVSSSTLPLPNNTPNPSPTPNPDPTLDYGQITQPENQSILDSFSNLQIPFLQNIRYRFPFCIPWDIRDAISLLQFSPTAPAWDFDWKITVLGTTYKYHCVGDLSDFDSLALLFRRLMLCAVFIGLAFWTYKLLL